MFIQAMVVNLTPLFFIPLREQFGLSFEQLGRLVLLNFATQMLVDLLCTGLIDRFGRAVKPLTVAAQFLAAAGLWLFAGAPALFPADPYRGLVLGTIIFSLGCGLLEVLLSPIINALPSLRKEADMALLNLAGFVAVKLPPFVHEAERERTRAMARTGVFWLGMFGILLAGATEVTLAQWTSAFAQTALGLSQVVADCFGFGLFGAMMVVGRLWFGFHGHNRNLPRMLTAGATLSAACYGTVALSPSPGVALVACIAAGLFVSLLWPGIVSVCAATFPRAGVSLFALLAAFGDAGAGLVPWLVGATADRVANLDRAGYSAFRHFPVGLTPEQLGLRAGLLLAMLCPAVLAVLLRVLHCRIRAKSTKLEPT